MYKRAKHDVGNADDCRGNVAPFLNAVGMQGVHHLASGVEVGCEVIHAEKSNGCEQADLTCAVDVGILLLFNRRGFVCQKNNYDEKYRWKITCCLPLFKIIYDWKAVSSVFS